MQKYKPISQHRSFDRAEKYLSAEKQNARHGQALVALIGILPASAARDDLLAIFAKDAQITSVAARAADANDKTAGRWSLDPKRFSGIFGLIQSPDVEGQYRSVDDFAFIDSTGVSWPLPKDTIITGSAIPRALWPTFGSPINGKMAPATALYEYHVTQRTASVDDVLRMFSEAMRALGTPEIQAKTILAALTTFGPRGTSP